MYWDFGRVQDNLRVHTRSRIDVFDMKRQLLNGRIRGPTGRGRTTDRPRAMLTRAAAGLLLPVRVTRV